MMDTIKEILTKDRDIIVWVIEFLSGISLLSYALLSLSPHSGSRTLMLDAFWYHPWIGAIGIVGFLQLFCSIFHHPLSTVLSAYPATFSCLFAGVYGWLSHAQLEPLSVFAITMGVINYTVVRYSWNRTREE